MEGDTGTVVEVASGAENAVDKAADDLVGVASEAGEAVDEDPGALVGAA